MFCIAGTDHFKSRDERDMADTICKLESEVSKTNMRSRWGYSISAVFFERHSSGDSAGAYRKSIMNMHVLSPIPGDSSST